MAWQTIRATEDLVVELWLASDAASEPLLKIRSTGTEDAAVAHLEEVCHLIDALVRLSIACVEHLE